MTKVILEMDENIGDERVGIRVRRNRMCRQGVLNRHGQDDVSQLLRGVVIDERRLLPLIAMSTGKKTDHDHLERGSWRWWT